MKGSSSGWLLLFQWRWRRFILTALILAGWVPAEAQAKLRAWASYDTSALTELFNRVPIGIRLTTPDGTDLATRGLLGGGLHWRDLTITSPQGQVQGGILTFDRRKVAENDHRVSLLVQFAGDTASAFLELPYVTALRFNLYTDSLKRDNLLDLNVEGLFSSGRIYPLDTSMVAYKVTAGKLEGNTLLIASGDTAIHEVNVRAWLKADPALRDQVTVPVKILPDTTALPSEQELLEKWKKRRR